VGWIQIVGWIQMVGCISAQPVSAVSVREPNEAAYIHFLIIAIGYCECCIAITNIEFSRAASPLTESLTDEEIGLGSHAS